MLTVRKAPGVCWVCALFMLSVFAHAQERPPGLVIRAEDIHVTVNSDGSADLFVVKKPDIASILLLEFPPGDAGREVFPYHVREPRPENNGGIKRSFMFSSGGLSYFLVDSSPEPDVTPGKLFHVYLQPVMDYGGSAGRHGTAHIQDGFRLNIRTFALPDADYNGAYTDNRFILEIRPPQPGRFVRAEDYTPLPETAPLPVEPFPVAPGILPDIRPVPPDLSIKTEDVHVTVNSDGSADLFVVKKPGIASLLLMEFPPGDAEGGTFPYHVRKWLPVNRGDIKTPPGSFMFSTGGISYFLVDSTPEPGEEPGKLFHVYMPPAMDYGESSSGRHGTASIQDGFRLNIRTFALPNADYNGAYTDNRFILEIRPPQPGRFVREEDYTPPPGFVTGDPFPDRPKTPVFPFPLDIRTAMGASSFSPGPDGKVSEHLELITRYVFTGAVSLEAPITQKIGLRAGYERDALSMNQFYLRGVYDFGLAVVEAGLNTGMFNTNLFYISPALSAAARASSPGGRVSGTARADFALNREMNATDEYFQDYYAVSVRVDTPAARLGAAASSRSEDRMDRYLVKMVSRWTRYFFFTEFPLKAWTIRLESGYQNLSWEYAAAQAYLYRYWSIFTGMGALVRLGSSAALFWSAEAPVYPWVYPAINDLLNPQAAILWKAEMGVQWHVGPPG